MAEFRIVSLLLATSLLAACAAGPAPMPAPPAQRPPVSQPVPPTQPAPRPVAGFRQPEIMQDRALAGVIRADSASLRRQFGEPRLNVAEGDMRKLQFSGEPCVLDIFMYPLAPGAEPVATWVEARRASDGAAVDRAACVQALSRRR